LRAIQCVLIRTRGLVGTKRDYFLKAFGNDHEEFYKILLMPESYIIHRFDHEGDGSTDLWWSQVCSLTDWEREIFEKIVCNQQHRAVNLAELPRAVRNALRHYVNNDFRILSDIDENISHPLKNVQACQISHLQTHGHHRRPGSAGH